MVLLHQGGLCAVVIVVAVTLAHRPSIQSPASRPARHVAPPRTAPSSILTRHSANDRYATDISGTAPWYKTVQGPAAILRMVMAKLRLVVGIIQKVSAREGG